jgi:hypothetical protein
MGVRCGVQFCSRAAQQPVEIRLACPHSDVAIPMQLTEPPGIQRGENRYIGLVVGPHLDRLLPKPPLGVHNSHLTHSRPFALFPPIPFNPNAADDGPAYVLAPLENPLKGSPQKGKFRHRRADRSPSDKEQKVGLYESRGLGTSYGHDGRGWLGVLRQGGAGWARPCQRDV